jgi:SPP1 family predicted phage head-tail adaptor
MAKPQSIGALRERIEVQSLAETKDAMGAPIQAWSTLATLWAEVRPASSGETWRRQQMQSSAGWTVVIRHRADLTPQMRIVWTNLKTGRVHTFQIKGTENPDMRGRFLEIACEELSAAGP